MRERCTGAGDHSKGSGPGRGSVNGSASSPMARRRDALRRPGWAAAVLVLLSTGIAANAQVMPLAQRVGPLDGSATGGVTSVAITASSPLTGTATCASGACAFTLGLTSLAASKLYGRGSAGGTGAA